MERLPTSTVVALLIAAAAVGALGMGTLVGPAPPTADLPAGEGSPSTSGESAVVDPAAEYDRGSSIDGERLYRETIDSVVTVHVAREDGGGTGSGFVYDDDGHVVTNHHVIDGGERFAVRFADGTWREAEVVGDDRRTDLAVLSIDDPPATAEPLPLADENPPPGRDVAAIGSPLRLEGSITVGVVSGIDRSLRLPDGTLIPDVIQTDAAINPGNSGGPLFDADGTVVGVNTARYDADNVGFAVSARLTERVAPALIEDGKYDHPYLGVDTRTVTPAIAEANDLPEPRGAAVVGVDDGSPANGLLQRHDRTRTVGGETVPVGGDVIVDMDGQPIDSREDVHQHLAVKTTPGDDVDITVIRDGERETVTVTISTR